MLCRSDGQLESAPTEDRITKSRSSRKGRKNRIGRNRAMKSPRAFDLVKELSGSVNGPADLLTNPLYMDDFVT